MAIKQANQRRHVVVVPYPAQGHINPTLQLCKQLVPFGFTFTFVNTHHIHQRVQRSTQANTTHNNPANGHTHVPHQNAHVKDGKHAAGNGTPDDHLHANGAAPHVNESQVIHMHSQKGLKNCDPIRMVFVEGGCAPEQHAYMSTTKEALAAAQAMKEQVEQLISNIMEEQTVVFLLTDILMGWASDVANKFGLPWVCFWPASAVTCSIFSYLGDVSDQGKLIPLAGKEDGEVPVLDDIPGLPPTSLNDMPKVWDDTGNLRHQILKYFTSAEEQAACLLINTFSELEGDALQALSNRCLTLAIGPLLPSQFMSDVEPHTCTDKTKLDRPSLFKEDRTCLHWLDKQAASSVLFISFGSISARTEEQFEELAQGVEASGCPFLWVRRPDITADQNGPATAVKVRENGLIVPWAPQLEVLSHPAVGGFITHCGWNSVMESVGLGVPMLCWADTGERMSNQRYVVHMWKCGMDMVADSSKRYKQHVDEAVLVRREEIERSIRCLMREESGAPIRARAAQLRHLASSAFNDASPFHCLLQKCNSSDSSLH